jgi:hypothetical protein
MIITAMPNRAIKKKIIAVCMALPHLVVSNQSAAKWPAHRLAYLLWRVGMQAHRLMQP